MMMLKRVEDGPDSGSGSAQESKEMPKKCGRRGN